MRNLDAYSIAPLARRFLQVRNILCCRAIFICRGTISQSRRVVLASFPRHIKFYSGGYTKEEKTHRVRAFYVTRAK